MAMAIVAEGIVDMSGREPQVTEEMCEKEDEKGVAAKRTLRRHKGTAMTLWLALTSPPPPWVVRRA